MAAPQDKRRQLDDEMSRFEAEILSGPLTPSSGSLNAESPAELRPIIGASTFDQVKQQLKQATSDDIIPGDHIEKPRPPPPPPGPPQLTLPSPSIRPPQQSGPNQPPSGIRQPLSGPRHPLSGPGGQCSPSQFGPGPQRYPQNQGSFGPPVNNRNSPSDQYGPGPNQPGPPEHYGQGSSSQFGPPGPYGPGPNRPGPFGQGPNRLGPPGFGPGSPGPNRLGPPGIGPFGPGQSRPGPPGPGPFGPGPNQPGPPGSGSFCPQMDAGPYPPHPSNHGFMGPRGRNVPGGMAPPPGFIPPQVNRLTNNGPMMMGPGPHGRPRPPAPFLPPPPPPLGYMPQSGGQRMSSGPLIRTGNSSVISKPPTVISSAPMLYTDSSKAPEKEDNQNKKFVSVSQNEITKRTEPRKKKKGTEEKKINKVLTDTSVALEMADRVKQSMVTVKHSVQTIAQPQTHVEEKKKERKHKKNLRYAGGQVWEDQNLADWDSDDFRLFVGDLGNDVTDDLLHRQFCHYASFQRAKVIRDKRTNKSKGYGFISFNDPQDYIRAMKEMNGKYLGSRPIKLRKSTWKDRNLDIVQKKLKEKQLAGLK